MVKKAAADKKDSLTVAKTKDDAVKKDTEMKAWEEELAKRLTARIAGWGVDYPYDMPLLESITSLRMYHDLIYD